MKKILTAMAIIVNLYGWEINTHRAIDRKALKASDNLAMFVESAGIKNQNYDSEMFDGYGKTYLSYIEEGEKNGISDKRWKQDFIDVKTLPSYQKMIEAGAILEDAQWPHWLDGGAYNIYDMGNGRFVNHFYDPQDTQNPKRT